MDELQTLIDKWDLILSTFKEEHEIIDVSFKTWIKPLKIYKLDGNVLTLTFSSSANPYTKLLESPSSSS